MLHAVRSRIPPRLRRILHTWLLRPWRRLYSIYDRMRPRFYVAESRQGTLGLSATVLCACEKRNRSFLLGQVLGSLYREHSFGRAWLWNAAKRARRIENCGAVFVHGPADLRNRLGPEKYLAIPALVVGEVELPLDPHVLAARSVKDDFRRIRSNALTFEVTHDLQQFDDFYYNMHVPYIRHAHGESAFLIPYDTMHERFDRCDLLLVSTQGETIAGILIRYSGAEATLWSLGVRDGSQEFVRKGAVGALYHFSFRHLMDRGFTRVGLGNSRAFLQNGTLRYKRKIGLRLTGTFAESGYFYLRRVSDTEPARMFLRANPFIFERDGGLYGMVFPDVRHASLDEEQLERIYRDFYIEGMSRLFIVPLSGAVVAVPPELAEKIRVCHFSEIFGGGL